MKTITRARAKVKGTDPTLSLRGGLRPLPNCLTAQKRFLSGARRESTQRIGKELLRLLQDGAAVVNVSELARRTGHSRSTIYRSLAFFQRFGKILAVDGYHTGQGHPGRPIKYRLNPAYTVNGKTLPSKEGKVKTGKPAAAKESTANSEEKGVSSKRVNPSTTPQEDLKQDLPRLSTSSVLRLNNNDQRQKLTAWLTRADVDRTPTDQERRKLSVAVRLMVPPVVADPLLDALWWRTKTSLRLWRDVIGAIWSGTSAFDASEEELTWIVRHGLKRLEQDGDRQAFLDALQNEPLEAQKRRTERRLQGLGQWRLTQGEDCAGAALSWFVETRRSLERDLETLEAESVGGEPWKSRKQVS